MRSVRRFVARILLLLVASAVTTAVMSGCVPADFAPAAIFRPASPGATSIHNLSVLLLVIAGVVLVGVEAVLLTAIFRFRNRPEERAVQTHGNRRLETGWTVATSLAVVVILVLTVRTMGEATAVPSSTVPLTSAFAGDPLLLRVVGHQWWWTFEYPELKIVTANEVHVPAGKAVKLQLEADDVIHSFWAPSLAGKTDTIPGQINYSTFLATEPGIYEGECAEFCGLQHAHMGFKIVADSAADFAGWVAAQQAMAAPPVNEAQRSGEQAFQRACAGCHTIAGTNAQGKMGPDLTHLASRRVLAANTLQNTPAELAAWLRDPQAVKPGNQMPNLKLDQGTIDQLVAYLENLK